MSRLVRQTDRPLVIAHRGACGELPEQTIEAFDLGIRQGADAIELDIVPTRDGVLLARHESELSATTNVGDDPECATRRTTRVIEGGAVAGFFANEFTASEIGRLRARQRFPFRDRSHDDRYAIPSLDDVLEWRSRRANPPGVYIEIKHPTHFAAIGLTVPDLLLPTLRRHGALAPDSGVVLMSFETTILRDLRGRTELPLIQLLDAPGARPFDWETAQDPRTYRDLLTPEGLREIALYADGIGAWERLIVPAAGNDVDGAAADALRLANPTSLIRDAHAAGLFVAAWTFRDDPGFLARDYDGDPAREYAQFRALALDAFITDFPATALQAMKAAPPRRQERRGEK